LAAVTTAVEARFREVYGGRPAGVWAAPGRVNLIGEHTDYNDGFVLPFALPLRTEVAAAPLGGPEWTVWSAHSGETVTFTGADLVPGAVAGWAAYVAGVVWALREAGHEVPGARLAVTSDLPVGAGLSSSAALECAVLTALADLAGLDLPVADRPALAQRAEHRYVGMPCGIMDQSAATLCRAGHALFLDCRSGATAHVPLDLAAAGLALLVIDTRAPHRLVGGEYAARRAACERAAAALGVPALRDLDPDGDNPDGVGPDVPTRDGRDPDEPTRDGRDPDEPTRDGRDPDRLAAALDRLADPVLRRRARHVATENRRVLDTVALLRAGAVAKVGPLLSASHASLRDDFEVTVPELDVAAEAAEAAGAHGARMTGGGFGGCVIALVDAGATDRVAAAVADAFAGRGFTTPAWFVAEPAAGATRLS
jgi:galactokinase